MKSIHTFLIAACIFALMAACNEPAKETDTTTSGTIDISVDETFRPVIEQQLRVFDSSFPEAHIRVHYKPELACIQDFLNDSARLILVTRRLLADEAKLCEQRKIVPTSLAVAKDAVAVILHPSNPDSTFSVSEIKGILTGQYKKKYTVVFDNEASSTVRYMTDSILKGQKLGANVFAAHGNDSVIAYVARNPNAIGFVGVGYVSDMQDKDGLAFITNIKVAHLFNDKLQKAFQPYQAYIAPDYYPFTRNLFYIHSETYPGLGTGFANFLSRERGQLIFKQARLFPLRTNIIFREAAINNSN